MKALPNIFSLFISIYVFSHLPPLFVSSVLHISRISVLFISTLEMHTFIDAFSNIIMEITSKLMGRTFTKYYIR